MRPVLALGVIVLFLVLMLVRGAVRLVTGERRRGRARVEAQPSPYAGVERRRRGEWPF